MKLLFIAFLLLNVCYFGWELDRQTRIEVSNSVRPFDIPANTPVLELLKELEYSSDATSKILPETTDEIELEKVDKADDEFTDQESSPLQNIASMMEQGNVMIEKKVIDELVSNIPDFSTNNIQEPVAEKIICVSFGPFAEKQQADELSNWLQKKEIQTNQRTEGRKQDQYLWIYLSASESEDEAMAAIEDLKGKGVQDYKLINKGNLQNAISLGLFSTQSAVNDRLNELKGIGYQPIIVPYHQKQSIIWVNARVDANDANQGNVLSEFINGYPSRFNSIPVKCEELFDALEAS
ncbi:MAG: SPOR domain-containing protein [Proteobacteria bacterium]|nr:SPOR domain-containing protein [Pseudomonadota bacterium]